MAAKPGSVIGWVASGEIEVPSAGKKTAGWLADERPPAQEFNWYWNLVSQWIDYLNDQVFTGVVQIPVLVAGTASIGAAALNNVISPSAIGSNQDNWAPTDIDTANLVRINTSGTFNITGIDASQVEGRVLFLLNIGSHNVTLANEDANSTDVNRFRFGGLSNIVMTGGVAGVVGLLYDATLERWVNFSGNGGLA